MTAPRPLPEDGGQWLWHPAPVSPADEAAVTMERKWGVDRLPRLVSPETRQRFEQAHALRNGEYEFATVERRAALDAMMARAWAALDAEALGRGCEVLPPAIYEIPLEGCPGAVAALCLDDEHAQAVRLRAKAEGRTVSTWTIAEVVRVIQANELVNVIKDAWPGAKAERPRRAVLPDDEIPFGGEGAP